MLPVVLDWTIGTESCGSAQTILCGGNSICYDPDNGYGYRCQCKPGYDGNPYIQDGCQDIDECSASSLNNCTCPTRCVNTEGNYTCSCPRWKRGDGRNDGKGCSPTFWSSGILNGIGIGVGVLLLLLGGSWFTKLVKTRKMRKLKEKFFKRNGGLLLQQQLFSSDANVESTKLFNSKDLEKATDKSNVYKGMLPNGMLIAVKKSKVIDEGKVEEFINEVVILSQINHRNVVKLLGCCLETEVPLLVYEFIPNGTLSQYLNDQNEEFSLTWNMRLRIATEVAGALFYLHSGASSRIYHRDIKSTNVLLDEKYRAKLADFGTSRSVDID